MASFMDRIRKLLGRKPKKQRPDTSQPTQNGAQRPHGAQHEQHHQQQPIGAVDGAADDQFRAEAAPVAATRSGQLTIALVNQTQSNEVYAYITGTAIDNNNSLFLLSADGRTPIFPGSPSATATKIPQNISIRLGAPGATVRAVIPRLAGGRIWFSVGAELVFRVNPGPGLIEPSVFNQSDPNIHTNFGFTEFTFNEAQVFANISYVDFISIPIALSLRDTNGRVQRVAGLPPNGLETIANGLRAQTKKDGRRWSSLIVPRQNGQPLRILSPNSALLLNPTWFQDYYGEYVNKVWDNYRFKQLTVDTQASFGKLDGQVRSDGLLDLGAAGTFRKPSTGDVFSCSTGPFATGSNAARNAVIPRLAAAFNRSILLLTQDVPNGAGFREYYTTPITNHYSRIVHEANTDKHGYAFPYDDVTPDGGVPQEGAVFSFSPETLTITVGGR